MKTNVLRTLIKQIMVSKKIEKTIFKTTVNSLFELGLFQQKSKLNESGIIYTICRMSDKKIFIGYRNELSEIKKTYFNNDDSLIETRPGTKNELNLLKSTLLELGHSQENNFGCYEYSQTLIRHLNILGWPIEKFFPKRNQIKKVKL